MLIEYTDEYEIHSIRVLVSSAIRRPELQGPTLLLLILIFQRKCFCTRKLLKLKSLLKDVLRDYELWQICKNIGVPIIVKVKDRLNLKNQSS